MQKPTLHKTLTILATLCITLAGTATQAAESTAPQNTSRLQPETAAIINSIQTPDQKNLEQDVYSALLGIETPEGMDYIAIGAQVTNNNTTMLKKALQTRTAIDSKTYDNATKHYANKAPLRSDFKIDEQTYQYACRPLNNTNCVEQTTAQKEQILSVTQKASNQLLMQRYMQLRDLPQYNAYIYTEFEQLPSYQHVIQLSSLQLAQAIFAINEGDVDTGFKLLTDEMNFAKRMLLEDDLLIGKMISIVMLYNNYHTISELIDTPQMKPYQQDPRLLKLIAPLNQAEQTALVQAFENERNLVLFGFYMAQLGENYDRDNSANITYKIWEPAIERANMPMDQVANLYAQNKLTNLAELSKNIYQEEIAQAKQARQKDPSIPSNVVGQVLLEGASPNFETYLNRLYDLQSYILMTNMKLQIINKELKADQIDAFLQTAGAAAQNPITREPFIWNAQEGTLSTSWISEQLPAGAKGNTLEENMSHNTVYLKLAN